MTNPLSHKFKNDSEPDKLRGNLDSKSVPSGRKNRSAMQTSV